MYVGFELNTKAKKISETYKTIIFKNTINLVKKSNKELYVQKHETSLAKDAVHERKGE